MTTIDFMQVEPARGGATVDTSGMFIGTDGTIFFKDSMNNYLHHANPEQIAALQQHFGALLSDAVAGMKALA